MQYIDVFMFIFFFTFYSFLNLILELIYCSQKYNSDDVSLMQIIFKKLPIFFKTSHHPFSSDLQLSVH
jgi:hypothetical protein